MIQGPENLFPIKDQFFKETQLFSNKEIKWQNTYA